eukprot:TRINITY_DN62718_c0_g1_i1.p1 TRINITY_DN62718_c0_g1~~TRINITY_DN62718_c0_g1_i1.p1  ORF type:complete len:239 (+),score=65.86 TRINITY_DN62718_c0_g1_i1:99-719(+)
MATSAAADRTGPSDAALEREIGLILSTADLEKTSMKVLRGELEKRLGLKEGAMDDRKDIIQNMIVTTIERLQRVAANYVATEESEAASPTKKARMEKKGKKDTEVKKDEHDLANKRPPTKDPQEPQDGTKAKRTSNMTKEDYVSKAKEVKLKVGDHEIVLEPRVYSSGSCGFYKHAKFTIDVDGTLVTFQANFQGVAVGSKDWPEK